MRYASHIYGIQPFSYTSADYLGNITNNRTNELTYKLDYAPNVASILRLEQAFHFENKTLEFGKISSFISLFGDVPWLSLRASNTINPQQDDWGNILLEARLQNDVFTAVAKHRHDLAPEPLRADPTILVNETQSALELQHQVTPQISSSVKTAYNYQPLKAIANNQPRYWESLDFSVRFYESGTSAQLNYSYDLNEGISQFYGFQTQFQIQDLRVSIHQNLWPETLFKHSNSWRLVWDDVIGIELSNYPFLSLTQYFDNNRYDRTERIRVFDDVDNLNFEVSYSRNFDSRLERNNSIGHYKNSLLSFKFATNRLYDAKQQHWLKLRSNLDYRLADVLQPDNYLDRFSLNIALAKTAHFALATEFSYKGIHDGETVDQHLYELKQFTATAQITDDIYISTSFNNPWTYSSNSVNPISWSPYPTFYFIYEPNGLDFYAFVESETRSIGIGLGFSDLLGFQVQDGKSLVLP